MSALGRKNMVWSRLRYQERLQTGKTLIPTGYQSSDSAQLPCALSRDRERGRNVGKNR